MILNHLTITNYRNIGVASLEFSPNINCLVGANGMGKSNVLDAIYYLSFCRGFASAQDALNVNHDTDYFILESRFVGLVKQTSALSLCLPRYWRTSFTFDAGTFTLICSNIKNNAKSPTV